MMDRISLRISTCILLAVLLAAIARSAEISLKPVRVANPVSGHVHPAICQTSRGTLVVIYGRVNHRDLQIVCSIDGGATWSPSEPFPPTVGQTYYPGSLTTLANGVPESA